MLIIPVDHGESIEKALKRYKNKHRRTRLMQEIRERKFFTRGSVKRRKVKIQAAYRDQKLREMEEG